MAGNQATTHMYSAKTALFLKCSSGLPGHVTDEHISKKKDHQSNSKQTFKYHRYTVGTSHLGKVLIMCTF